MATSNTAGDTVLRRCANYKPSVWTHDFIQSLKSKYLEEAYAERRDELKEEVKMILLNYKVMQPLDQLQLVDVLQRLCLGYHFQDEIRAILDNLHSKCEEDGEMKNPGLLAAALRFRLLRQNGYNAAIESFDSFKDDSNQIRSECMGDDVDTMLALYEASFLSMESETILCHAKDLAAKHLREYLERAEDRKEVKACLVEHALEIPLHWRMQRVEARWFIGVYETMKDMNHHPMLVELAKLDYNIVQAIHQQEIKKVSRWWRDSDLCNKMSFARDRVMECFLWAMGLRFEPVHKYYRVMMAKLTVLITIMDDLYDVHGTVEELELFTKAVQSWNVESIDSLPEYMKVYFLTLYNCVNETVCYALKESGLYVMKYTRKAWADLCESYIREAKWYHSGYKTTSLQEYIDNGWRSIALQAPIYEAFFMIKHPLTNHILTCLDEFPSVVVNSSMVLRLVDDLGTFQREQEQGDISNAILCYVKETGESEEEAVTHFRAIVEKYWKKMNEDLIGTSSLPHIFIETTMNVSRVGVLEYQRGDGFTVQDQWSKNLTRSLFVDPIPMY